MSMKHFTIKDPTTWYQHTDRQIFLGDVVSWQVSGIRKDSYAETHRIPVEVDQRMGDHRAAAPETP